MEAIEVLAFVPAIAAKQKGIRIRLSKIGVNPNAEVESASWDEHIPGSPTALHGKSLPVDYWIEGYLIDAPTVGGHMSAYRTIRNGVEVPGYFTSSQIEKIEGDLFYTANSIYKLEYLDAKNTITS